MTKYKATITPKKELEADESQVAMLRMEITFSIGGFARKEGPWGSSRMVTPQSVIQGAINDLHLTGLVEYDFEEIPE